MSTLIPEIAKNVLSVVLLLPLLWFFIRQNNKYMERSIEQFDRITNAFEQHTKEDVEALTKIYNSLEAHSKDASDRFARLFQTIRNTTLNEEQTLDLLSNMMWYVSWKKLDFIKTIITQNHITWRRDFITEKVKTWLAWFSEEYNAKFSTYNTPIWNLSEWLSINFTEKDFDKFIWEVVDVIYRADQWEKEIVTVLKIAEISQMMKTLQMTLRNKLRKDLKII